MESLTSINQSSSPFIPPRVKNVHSHYNMYCLCTENEPPLTERREYQGKGCYSLRQLYCYQGEYFKPG